MSQVGTRGGTVHGTSESSDSCLLSWSSAAAAATATGQGRGFRDLRKGGHSLGCTALVGGSLRRRHVCGKREGRLSEPRRLGPSRGEGKGGCGGGSRREARRGDRGSRSDRGRRGRGDKVPARKEDWGDAGPKGEPWPRPGKLRSEGCGEGSGGQACLRDAGGEVPGKLKVAPRREPRNEGRGPGKASRSRGTSGLTGGGSAKAHQAVCGVRGTCAGAAQGGGWRRREP